MDKKQHENAAEKILNFIAKPSWKLEREYRFHPTRKWRFDFAYSEQKIAIEIEGGIWSGGRHIHPSGFEADCIKYNTATAMGWKVFRVPPKFISEAYLKSLLG